MKKLLLLILFSVTIVGEEKNLILFLDKEREEQIDTDFNVSYQFVVALLQEPGEILVAQSLLQNVIQRKELFQNRLKEYGSVESEFIRLFNAVKNNITKKSIRLVNKQMNQRWVSQSFSQISNLSQEKYKQLAFSFLCFYVCKALGRWSFVRQKNGFILCSLNNQKRSLSQGDILHLSLTSQGSVVPGLRSLVKNKKDKWVIYLSGHGHPKGESGTEALISGMRVGEFGDFLSFLENKMNTNLLVYNSCFAGGRDGLSVYKKGDQDLLLSYSVIMTSIADAPTYVFGTPSGFKLPPYSFDNQLDQSDIRDGRFQPFFFQYFPEFFEYAHQQFCDDQCMFLINHYKQCVEQGCPVYQIENVPMVRYPESNRFVPLDDRDHFVFDEIFQDKVVLEDQKAVLWYQAEYGGTAYCVGSIPIFLSMNHNKINRHTIHELVVSTNIETFLTQAFTHLEDHDTESIWNIDTLIVQTRRGRRKYHNVQVVQSSHGMSWTI